MHRVLAAGAMTATGTPALSFACNSRTLLISTSKTFNPAEVSTPSPPPEGLLIWIHLYSPMYSRHPAQAQVTVAPIAGRLAWWRALS